MKQYYVGIDLGGTGSRLGIWHHDRCITHISGEGVKIGARGTNVADLASDLVSQGLAWIASNAENGATLGGVGLGATGIATLLHDQHALADQLAFISGCEHVAVAADVVTAHLGALGGLAGAVVAVGTGSIALGTNFHDVWRRVDGHGHLLGDRGAGAWIGMEGLQAAARYADGVDSRHGAIFEAATERFGSISQWPQALYTVPNRAGVLASFAADVIALADHDPSAADIISQAATHIAASLLSALPDELPPNLSAVGGIMKSSIGARVERLVADAAPGITWIAPQGTPLDGAGILAHLAAGKTTRGTGESAETLGTHEPYVWVRRSHPAQP